METTLHQMAQKTLTARRPNSTGGRVYFAVLVLLLLVGAAGFWNTRIRAITSLGELDYGEGIVLYQATLLQDLHSAFKPIDQYPFVVFHYPPVYHYAVRAFTPLTGDIVSAGRWVSVLSSLLIELTFALLIFFSLPRKFEFTSRLGTAIFGGLLVNSLAPMRFWANLARVDMLAHLLSFAGIAVFCLAGRRRNLEYLAFLLFVASVFTRQTMVAAPLACLTVLMFIDIKRAVKLALFGAIVGATVLGVLSWITQGGVIRHWFLYNQNVFSVIRAWHGLTENMSKMVPISALAGATAIAVGIEAFQVIRRGQWQRLKQRLRFGRYRRLAFVCSFLLVYALIISLTYGKMGSSVNYFLEWNMVCCPLAALTLFRTCASRRYVPAPLLATVYLLPLLIAMQAFPDALTSLRADYSAPAGDDGTAAMITEIRSANGPVLSEDMTLLVRAGKEVPAEPAIIQQLAETGAWDQGLLVKMIEEHRFPMIVFRNLEDSFTPVLAAAIVKSYPRRRSVGKYQVYEPESN